MLPLVFFSGLITGVLQAVVVRVWFPHPRFNSWIVVGAILGSGMIYLTITANPQIFNPILHNVWTVLGPPLGAGFPSGGNFGVFLMLPLTILLIQILGSLLGGACGFGIWLTFFRH